VEEGARPAIPHISALDGARGVAVAGVLLFHGGHLLGGYLGVDFFFVLSGFLITSLLLAESARTGSIGLGGFWARRARRLLPALAVLMIGVAIYCIVLATPDQLAQIRGDALATLGYVANWREVFAHQNYFALFTSPSPLNHAWSLSIEEQFYVIWPLVFFGLLSRFRRATPKAVLVTSLVLAATSSVLMIALYDPANVAAVYYGTETRAAAILFGAALGAWLAIRGPAQGKNARVALEAAGIVGAIVLAIAWARLDGQSSTLYRGGFLLCGLAATAVIAAAVHPTPRALSRVLSLRPLCALGLISYGVYLYHWPIDVALDQNRLHLAGWPLLGVQTAVTLLIATASYRFVEQPIRRGALSSFQWRRLTPAIAFALVVVVLVGTNGAQSSNAASGLSFPLLAADRAAAAARPGAVRVMVVGDSVAFSLATSMAGLDADPPAVFNAAYPGCIFPPEVTQARYSNVLYSHAASCDPNWEPEAVKRFHPNIVFWIVNGPASSVLYNGRWIDTCSTEYASLYRRAVRTELGRLAVGGVKVVMTTEAYPRYVSAEVDKPTDCENGLRRAVAASTGVQLIDLQAYICPKGQCREKQNGVTLRADGEHYEGPGGRIVARWLLDQVKVP
jgi:peptidoglycan/LPS O-acetylase OafA/YrhL